MKLNGAPLEPEEGPETETVREPGGGGGGGAGVAVGGGEDEEITTDLESEIVPTVTFTEQPEVHAEAGVQGSGPGPEVGEPGTSMSPVLLCKKN
ncbi:MAG TPA: hypothetical protein VK416_12200 [Thermoanaerobaculia bacterium]|nr:hypothetical protein [Thermoanaerobaculia bacterium]